MAQNLSIGDTFVPRPAEAAEAPQLDSLPELTLVGEGARPPELALHGLLGEGGRGEVRVARQLPLRREVAVKCLKGAGSPALTEELLREARITGNLEHPGIVPVYALGQGSDGRVLLVMKKVGGTPWGRMLREESAPRTEAQLERHLEIFRQVCNAVEFAHARGIVHRDLKPDNVMVGEFGEVVVLDWGLAVSLAGDPERGLPAASSLRGMAGTPAYMAPELVSGEGALIGRWTDVYLLGAILHEILTGTPPHQGLDLQEVLARARASEPPRFGPLADPELTGICRQAMHADPARRFQSVARLREAVRDHLRHRQSAQLAEEANRRLAQLPPFNASLSPELAAGARRAIAQSFFGFQQALRGWPENPVAREGLRRVAEEQVRLELLEENLAGAERALLELPAPDAALASEVEVLRLRHRADAEKVAQLRQLERDLDLEVTGRFRNGVLVVLGVVWCVVPLGADWLERSGLHHLTRSDLLEAWGLYALVAAVTMAVTRRKWQRNRLGRRVAGMMALSIVITLLVRLPDVMQARLPHAFIAPELTVYGAVVAGLAVFVDLRFTGAAVVYLASAGLVSFRPEWDLRVIGAANLFALVPTALLWDRLQRFGREAPAGIPPRSPS